MHSLSRFFSRWSFFCDGLMVLCFFAEKQEEVNNEKNRRLIETPNLLLYIENMVIHFFFHVLYHDTVYCLQIKVTYWKLVKKFYCYLNYQPAKK